MVRNRVYSMAGLCLVYRAGLPFEGEGGMTITIPVVPKSLNEISCWHHMKRYCYGKSLEKTVWAYCLKAKQEQGIIWKKFSRVEITFYYSDNRRRDVDNAISGWKKGLDGLVLSKLIEDDSYQTAKITYEIKKGSPSRTEIELW